MAQHDYNIADQNGLDFLADLNSLLTAVATNNAGPNAPSPPFASMLWFDTNNDLMKVRNEANSAWIIMAKKDGNGWTPYRQGVALGTASVQSDGRYAHRSNNLSDLASAATARGNLGVAADSSDANFANAPDAAARRDLVKAKLDALATLKFNEFGPIDIVSGGPVTLSHGLGEEPKNISLLLECVGAERGYTVGERVFVDLNNSSAADSRMTRVKVTSSSIFLRFSGSGSPFILSEDSSGNAVALGSLSNWKLYVKALA